MQDLFAFLIPGVGRHREDQFIYVETRENVFLIIWDQVGGTGIGCNKGIVITASLSPIRDINFIYNHYLPDLASEFAWL